PAPPRWESPRWESPVALFSSLRLRAACRVSVLPLDLHGYPDGDRAFVRVFRERGSALGARGVSVDYSDSHKRLQVTGNERAVGYQLEVTVPIKFDLDLATSGDGGVHVGSMESDVCSVRTDRGGVHLASIKGADISVESEHGNVSIGSLQGNVNIHARGCNSVNIDKLQAIKACVSTKRGPLNAKFIYAESSQFSSTSGTVNLGSTHGNTVVTTDEGHIVIESLDGGLVARTRAGDVTVHLSQPSAVDLYSERGDVNIKFPDSLGLEFLVTGGKGVVVSPDVHLESMELSTKGSTQSLTGKVGRLSKGGMLVRATSKHGTVRLQRQSWFQSLGLKG
uniref:Family with sequence similarity 185 member A n=1 Tax=Petromyzon marinus TaxID=7757 RepID=S4RA28_PETMA